MTHASLTHTGLIKIQPPPSFTALDKSQGLWQQIESSKSLCELHTILQKPEAETQAGFSRCERNLNMGFSETASIKPTNQLSASTTHNLPAHCPTTCSILCAKLNNTILDALKFYKLKKKKVLMYCFLQVPQDTAAQCTFAQLYSKAVMDHYFGWYLAI